MSTTTPVCSSFGGLASSGLQEANVSDAAKRHCRGRREERERERERECEREGVQRETTRMRVCGEQWIGDESMRGSEN